VTAVEHPPISASEVASIGREHHGMLYQHVLAACFVARHAVAPFYERLVVEKDEDIEVACTGSRHYLQVKAVEGLVFSHLHGMLLRMHGARMRHLAGERAGDCKLYLVSGGTLGPELAHQRLDAVVLKKARALARKNSLDKAALVETWRAIEFVTPGSQLPDLGSTRVLAGVVPQLAYLVEIVANVTRLASAEVASAYALATSMHALAADSLEGFTARIVQASDTSRLIEVIRRQVEPLPELPAHFVPLPLAASTFVPGQHCVLLGDSGSGKSSQLAYIASSRTTPTVYLRPVGALPDEIVDQLRSALEALGVDLGHLGSSTAAVPAHEIAAQLVRALPATTLVLVDDVHLLSESPAIREFLRPAARRRDLCLALVGQAGRPDGSPTSSWIQALVGHRFAASIFLDGASSRRPLICTSRVSRRIRCSPTTSAGSAEAVRSRSLHWSRYASSASPEIWSGRCLISRARARNRPYMAWSASDSSACRAQRVASPRP
jgi:AAA domain-containing protein